MEAVRRVHAQHPDIRVLLSTSIQISNLTRREADLAIRNLSCQAWRAAAGHGVRRPCAGDVPAVRAAGLVRYLLRRTHGQWPCRHRIEFGADDHRGRGGWPGHR
ncbi:hypothetical protein G6F46_015311 [Rhizopus delemar]|nr:hypothetical protein G6F46_015311 [Rhizopus delemar]